MSAQYELNFNMRGSGFKVNETAGESLGEHKLVYRGADGYWWLADADAAATMPVLGITMGAIGGGRKGEILKWGYIGDSVWTWVAPGEIYASTTAGELTQTAPTGIGDVRQVVAKAVTDVIIEFAGNVNGSSSVYGDKITEASYIIFTQDVGVVPYYYAKNGTTGQIQFSGTDASTVIQTAITATSQGTILIKNGDYSVSGLFIQGKHDINLVGEGWGTKLIASGADTTVIMVGDRANILTSQRIIIANLYIDGSAQTTETVGPELNPSRRIGVEISGGDTADVIIKNCYFYNTGSDSVYGQGGSQHVLVEENVFTQTRGFWAAVHSHGGHYWTVSDNLFFDCDVGAARHAKVITGNYIDNVSISSVYDRPAIVATDEGGVVSGNWINDAHRFGIWAWQERTTITGNRIKGLGIANGVGVFLQRQPSGTMYAVVVDGNTIDGFTAGICCANNDNKIIISNNIILNSTEDGIRGGLVNSIISNNMIDGVTTYDGIRDFLSYNIITGNHFMNINRSGIRGNPAANYNTVTDNIFQTIGSTVINQAGANSIIRDNRGFATENSGTATITAAATSIVVNHGCSYTPSALHVSVVLTNLPTNDIGDVYVDTFTATQFTIRCRNVPGVATAIFNWRVIKTP